MTGRFFAWLVVLSAILTVVVPARAHETRTARIEIDALSTEAARIGVRGRATVLPPAGCTLDLTVLRCPDGLAGKVVDVDRAGADAVFVRMTGFGSDESVVVTARAPRLALPGTPAKSGVVVRYLGLGAEHVLTGLDHVLFLIALFGQAWLATRGVLRSLAGELARTATAFTVAHSLTLSATALGVVHIPVLVAEACIAASLVLVALDLGRSTTTKPVSRTTRAALSGAFGLVHGLGFASALSETRLPAEAQVLGLLAFNAGVEVGQLGVFLVTLAVVVALRRARAAHSLRASAGERLALASAYVVGSVGCAMFFLRSLAIFR